jgi:hypothetical protein
MSGLVCVPTTERLDASAFRTELAVIIPTNVPSSSATTKGRLFLDNSSKYGAMSVLDVSLMKSCERCFSHSAWDEPKSDGLSMIPNSLPPPFVTAIGPLGGLAIAKELIVDPFKTTGERTASMSWPAVSTLKTLIPRTKFLT